MTLKMVEELKNTGLETASNISIKSEIKNLFQHHFEHKN